MKTYISMVYRLKAEGISIDRAISLVAAGYCLTRLEVERLKGLCQ